MSDAPLYKLLIFVTTMLSLGLQASVQAAPAKTAETSKPAAATKHDGWIIYQKSQIVGDCTVYVTAQGIKALNDKHSLSMLCLPPYTEVILFSDRTKKYFPTPVATFRCPIARTLNVVNSGLLSETPMVKKDDTTYKDRHVHSYTSTIKFTQRQLIRFHAKELPGRAPQAVKSMTTEDLKVDPKVALVWTRFFGQPDLIGVPLFSEFRDLGGDNNESLSTTKLVHGPIADSQFVLPTTYKKAAKHEELYVSEDTADEMGLMMLGH